MIVVASKYSRLTVVATLHLLLLVCLQRQRLSCSFEGTGTRVDFGSILTQSFVMAIRGVIPFHLSDTRIVHPPAYPVKVISQCSTYVEHLNHPFFRPWE